MNSLHQLGAGARPLDRSADDLDGLLRAFFRAEVPEPWPVLKSPVTSSLHREGALLRHRSVLRSRFTLAASLLILSIGQLSVSSLFTGYVRLADNNRDRIEATRRSESGKSPERKPASAHSNSVARPPAKDAGILDGSR
jgi:hypothetical protein